MTIRLTALTDRLSLLSGFDRTHPKTGELLLIWNNHQDLDEVRRDRRTPYSVAVSRDEGKSWVKMKTLEDDLWAGTATLPSTSLAITFCWAIAPQPQNERWVGDNADDSVFPRLALQVTAPGLTWCDKANRRRASFAMTMIPVGDLAVTTNTTTGLNR